MTDKATSHTKTIAQIGERELIRRLRPWLVTTPDSAVPVSSGDDCAETQIPAGHLVSTTDLLVENVHFLRNSATPWRALGQKAAGANLSDLAAAGAQPHALLIGLSLPPDFLVSHVEQIYQGIHEAATAARAIITGGDTTRGDQLVISITALGWKDPAWATCLRSDARPGDTLYLTGPLGASRAAVQLLLNDNLKTKTPPVIMDTLLHRHYTPPLRTDVGLALSKTGQRTSLIDISDSLYNEASLLAEASGVQIEIHLDQIPIHPAAQEFCQLHKIRSPQFALFSGEEYELLISSPQTIENLQATLNSAGANCTLTAIGHVHTGSEVVLKRHGRVEKISNETFDHF